MIIWVRNLIVIFAILSVIYAVLTIVGRAKERKRLAAKHANSDARDQAIAQDMEAYKKSLRFRLIAGLFGLPLVLVIILLALAYA